MTIFRVQVFYQRSLREKWSNVWHNNAADMSTLQTRFSSIAVPDLLSILHPDCTLVRYLISDLAGDTFLTTEIGDAGTSADSGDMLPLFNSVKVLFNDGSFGRPDLKYFKGVLTESLQTDGELTPAFRTAMDVSVTTLLSDMDAGNCPFVSITGDEYATASVQSEVQMRQMHRRRRRTT